MVSRDVVVINECGIHLRPAGLLTQTCMKFKSNVILRCGKREVIGKSVLNVMAAGIKKGSLLTVECTGPDEDEALEEVVNAIASGLGEGGSE